MLPITGDQPLFTLAEAIVHGLRALPLIVMLRNSSLAPSLFILLRRFMCLFEKQSYKIREEKRERGISFAGYSLDS